MLVFVVVVVFLVFVLFSLTICYVFVFSCNFFDFLLYIVCYVLYVLSFLIFFRYRFVLFCCLIEFKWWSHSCFTRVRNNGEVQIRGSVVEYVQLLLLVWEGKCRGWQTIVGVFKMQERSPLQS